MLSLSRELHSATTLAEVLDRVLVTVSEHTRYRRAWLCIPLPRRGVEVVGYALADKVRVDQRMAALDVAADRWLSYLLTATEPVVVNDLREIPEADQVQVEYFGNRSLIAIPMLRVAERIGVLCVGTFASEGIMPPTESELELVTQIGALVSVVAARIRAEEQRRVLAEQIKTADRLSALGRMAGEISHDFNNILAVICANAARASAMLVDHPAAESVDEISLAAERAVGLTRQLLAFSRGEPMHRTEVRIDQVVAGMTTMLRSLLPPTVTLDVSRATAVPTVNGDAGQLEQVVMNTVINARDALPEGGSIRLETRLARVGEGQVIANPAMRVGDFVVLSVGDTGLGMSPEVVANVFEPFFTTKGPGLGTGLGLAAVHSILERHGGFAVVSSVEGQGSVFELYFPVSTQNTTERHVLVIEEDRQLRLVLQRALTRAGYRVTVAATEAAAREVMGTATPFSLVITERARERTEGAPPSLALVKPFDLDELVHQVRTLVA